MVAASSDREIFLTSAKTFAPRRLTFRSVARQAPPPVRHAVLRVSLALRLRLSSLRPLAAVVAGQPLDPFRTTGVVRQGDAVEAIAEYAQEMRADLIVMGIHVRSRRRPTRRAA